jgi:hypothetical protein
MSKIVDEVVAANKKYASGFGAKKDCSDRSSIAPSSESPD